MKLHKPYDSNQGSSDLAKFGKNLFKKILEYTSNDRIN